MGKYIKTFTTKRRMSKPEIIQPDDSSTRFISLTRGEVVLVDSDIYEYLFQWNWSLRDSTGKYKYAVRWVRPDGIHPGYILPMHREIMGMYRDSSPSILVDHINGNGLDNRKKNLRFANKSQNAINCRSRAGEVNGVNFHKTKNKWQASIRGEGKQIYLGSFSDKGKAIQARIDAEKLYYGEFVRSHGSV